MARKDEILKSFLKHNLIKAKYKLEETDFPETVREGLNSTRPIVKAISLIIEGLDGSSPVTDAVLRNQITQFLNNEAI